MESNYEKQVYIARELFLNYDQQEMIKKFQLKSDENYLYLNMLDRFYRISRTDGSIFGTEDGDSYRECLDYQVVMTIYDVLCYSGKLPTLAQEWCPLYSLQVTMSSPNDTTFTGKYAQAFSGKVPQLQEACRKIGGEMPKVRAGADVCWQFDFFDFFPIQMRFWDGDEEFAPKVQLLWDKNTLDFMHFETVYYAMGHLMERLTAVLDEREE